MKRMSYLILVVAAMGCIEGCKRSATDKKPAVAVLVEKDFTIAKGSTAFIDGLKPEAKPDERPNSEAENKAQQEKAEINQKLADANEKQKRKDDVEKIGQAVMAYCSTNPPKDQSLDKFKSYLRRAGLSTLRAEVDAGKVEVIFLALHGAPNHIVAYYKDSVDEACPVYEVGLPNVPKHPVTIVRLQDVPGRLLNQELVAIWRQVWEYSMPYYVNMPSDAPSAMRLKNLLNQGLPRDALATVRAQMPQTIKNPPDRRDLEKFKRYLKDNASPEFLAAVEGRYRVNLSADFNSPDDLVVCRGAPDPGAVHPTITSLGTINSYAQAVINERFLQK